MRAVNLVLPPRVFLLLIALTIGIQGAAARADLVADRHSQLFNSSALTHVAVDGMNYFGTAWVVNRRRGLLVTAYHCTYDQSTVNLFYPQHVGGKWITKPMQYVHDYQPIQARVLKVDKTRDLALLKVDVIGRHIKALPLAEGSAEVGSNVFTLGNPASSGRIWQFRTMEVLRVGFSALKTNNTGLTVAGEFVSVDGPIMGGFSGGALLDAAGRVTGVCVVADDKSGNGGYISVVDLRRFLGLSAPPSAPAPADRPLVGDWVVTVHNAGESAQAGMTFFEDGSFSFSKMLEKNSGIYTYQSGWLFTKFSDKPIEKVKVKWDGDQSFEFATGGIRFVFERYTAS